MVALYITFDLHQATITLGKTIFGLFESGFTVFALNFRTPHLRHKLNLKID